MSRIVAQRGWVVALAPTPELWARALPHRTQIVQHLDAATVAFELGLTDGSVLLEAGTGSGAATVAFARACAPSGRVVSFDFNAPRVEKAAADLAAMGLCPGLVDVRHGDVCADADVDAAFDAVFLDLPEPWKALDLVQRRAKPQARIAAYSPCLEQVQKTCAALRDTLHADDLVTVEARLRDFQLTHLDFQPFAA
ncbi:MAG: methyltransferase domain-containing protein, partial [Pseudomonadota bacterium]